MDRFSDTIDRNGTGSLKWDKFAGRDVLPMWVADMDLPSPTPVIEALVERARHGVFGYTIPYNEPCEAVLAYLRVSHGLLIDPASLYWLPGLVPALNLICRAFAGPKTEVLTATPVYPPFLSAPTNAHGKCIAVDLLQTDLGWTFDFDALERAVTPQTKIFILCNPHNPVGRVYNRVELDKLADFCIRHDLILVSDEIHCDLILNPEVRHVPALSLTPEIHSRLIALYAPSKTYNLPGLACAYAVIPDASLRTRLQREARGIITEVNAMGYVGCAAAYREGAEWLAQLKDHLRDNRSILYRSIAEEMPILKIHPMEATYLAWIDCRGLGLSDPATFFEQHGVGLSNGADFGAPGWVRLNFGCTESRLRAALERMIAAVRSIPSRGV